MQCLALTSWHNCDLDKVIKSGYELVECDETVSEKQLFRLLEQEHASLLSLEHSRSKKKKEREREEKKKRKRSALHVQTK